MITVGEKKVDLLANYYCGIDSFQMYELVYVGQVVKFHLWALKT